MIKARSLSLICIVISTIVSSLDDTITYTVISDIEVDTIFTVANSPYLINSQVDIAQDIVLTIENGVEIIFDEDFEWEVYGSIIAGCDELNTDLDQTTKGLTNTTDFTYIHGDPDNIDRAGSIYVATSGTVEFCNTKFEDMIYPFRYYKYPYNPSTFDNCEFTDVDYAIHAYYESARMYHLFTDCYFHDLPDILYYKALVDFERCQFETFSTFSSIYEFNVYDSIITGQDDVCLDYTDRVGDVISNTISNCNPALQYRFESDDDVDPSSITKHVNYNTFRDNSIAIIVEHDPDGVTEILYNNFISNNISLRLSGSHDIEARYNYFGDDSGALDQAGIQATIQDECSQYSSALALYSPWYASAIDFGTFPDVKPSEVELEGNTLDCEDIHVDVVDDDELNKLYSGGNVTLSAGNTYYIVHDTIIDENTILNVENGANIVFKEHYILEIRGTLIVGCNEVDVSADDNIGLLSGEATYSTISAVSAYDGRIQLGRNGGGTVKLCNTKVTNLDSGIFTYYNNGDQVIEVENCEFDSVYEIYLGENTGFIDATFTDTYFNGVEYPLNGSATMDHCKFEGFDEIHGEEGQVITNSIIDGSGSDGHCLSIDSDYGGNVIENNEIKNCQYGINMYVYQQDSDEDEIPRVRFNDFKNNSVGVRIMGSIGDFMLFEYNNFNESNTVAVSGESRYLLTINKNYFGASDEADVRAKIQDICNGGDTTSSSLQRLIYSPYYSEPIDLDNFDENNLPPTVTVTDTDCIGNNPFGAEFDNFLHISYSTDLLLTASDSPYYVVQAVQMEAGTTLTIENGAELIFKGDFYVDIYGDFVVGCDDIDTATDTTTRGLIDDTDYTNIYNENANQGGFRIQEDYIVDYLNRPKVTARVCNANISGFYYFIRCSIYCNADIMIDNVEFGNLYYPLSISSTKFPDNNHIVRDSTITNTRSGPGGYYVTVENNLISGITYSLSIAGDSTLINNDITGIGTSSPCLSINGVNNKVTGNTFSSCNIGIKINGGSSSITYNTIAAPVRCIQYSGDGNFDINYNNFIGCANLIWSPSSGYSFAFDAAYNYYEDSSGNALGADAIQSGVRDICSSSTYVAIIWYPFVNSQIDISDTTTIPTDITEVNETEIWSELCNAVIYDGITQYSPTLRLFYSENVTLTLDNSPYYVIGPVLIFHGVTLSIENGVEIIFVDEDYDMIVHGNLDIGCSSIDTSETSVIGLANDTNYTYLHALEDDNDFYHTYNYIYAYVGSRIDVCNTKFEGIDISDESGYYEMDLIVDNYEFSDSERPISLGTHSFTKITQKIITDSYFHDYQYYIYIQGATVENNLFEDFYSYALYAYHGSYQQPFMIKDNIIRNPIQYDIDDYMVRILLRNSNEGHPKSYFIGNQVSGGGIGLYVMFWQDVTENLVSGNTFKDNYRGMEIGSTDDVYVSCNNFIDNEYNFYFDSSHSNEYFFNNYWGVDDNTNISQIEAKISYSSYRFGDIVFWPWFTSEIENISVLPAALTYDFETDTTSAITVNSCDLPISMTSTTTSPTALSITGISSTVEEVCAEEDIGTFDWKLVIESGDDIPSFNVTDFYVDESDLSLNIRVELQYLGLVYADDQDVANWGVTYVLDFHDFSAHQSAINEPGTCGNKKGESFENATFAEYWAYSRQPIVEGVGNADNLAYGPPGDDWMIYMKQGDECSTVVYEGHFTWNDLTGCTNYDGSDIYTEIDNSDPNWLKLGGTFFIDVVSPFWYNFDFGYYRVYQLLAQPFIIQISKKIYVLGDTGINIMTMSIIAVSNEGNDYVIILLTETAEYMQLSNPTLVSLPTSSQYTVRIESSAENGDGCSGNKQFICTQIWKITISINERRRRLEIDNGTNETSDGIDFSGSYQIRFEPQCRSGSSESGYNFTLHCNKWLGEHDLFNPDENGIVLSSDLSFHIDGPLKAKVFKVQLSAEMSFYEDSTYSNEVGDSHLYQVGKDSVYVEIDVNFPDDTIDVFDTDLINVWLCTFPPETHVSEPSQNGTIGGCFDSQRDGFDASLSDPTQETFFFHIFDIQSSPILKVQGFELVNDTNGAGTRFAFIVPKEIERDTLYIHAQIEVTLQEITSGTRRRLLLNTNPAPSSNKISHFVDSIGIWSNSKDIKQPIHTYNSNELHDKSWMMVIGGIFALVLILSILFFVCYIYCFCDKETRNRYSFDNIIKRRNGYSSVKYIDSNSEDSEAHAINVENADDSEEIFIQ